MSVEQADVIDLISHDAKTNSVVLVMVEVRDWNYAPQAVQQLEVKLAAYAEFILAGQIKEQYPELAQYPVCIQLVHSCPIPDSVTSVLREWAEKLSSVPVGVWTRHLSWNPLARLLRRFLPRYHDPQHGLVRWTGEAVSTTGLVTRARFTEEFATALRAALPDQQVEVVQDLELKLIQPDGGSAKAFLHHAYDYFKSDPADKAAIIQKYAAAFAETGCCDGDLINKARIVPIIKDKGWLKEIHEAQKASGSEKLLESVDEVYNDELIILYAEDSPRNIRYLTPTNLAVSKLERKDLRKIACGNLEALLGAPTIRLDAGVYKIESGGDYDASLLLIDGLWTGDQIKVEGEIIVAIPARDFLAATGSRNAEGVKKLKAMAHAVSAQAPYRLTSKLFVYRRGTFEVFED